MKDNDLITRREVELVLLEKGQETGRYKWGEQWELNFSEIREALSEYQSEIVRCKDCKHGRKHNIDIIECMKAHDYNLEHQEFHYKNWFCGDGERGERAENARLSSSEIPNS